MRRRELIRPMLAVPGELPEDGGWVFELKWDGVRAVVYCDREVRAFSRNDRDITISYPEVLGLATALGGIEATLDGELVAFDPTGRPSFGTLQQRMHIADAGVANTLAARVPVVYVVFDLLTLDGHSLLRHPYTDRRELLEQLELDGSSWHTAPAFDGADGADVLRASREQGMEGVVAKRRDSVYEPGRRSPAWRKIKHVSTQEVVVGGWRPGSGRREGRIGSLMLGIPGAAGLRYVGQVGTGFSDALLEDLGRRLASLQRSSSPFDGPLPDALARVAHWVRPDLVGEVAFAEWTADGLLRQPSWRGLRPDKSPGDVRYE